MKTLLDSLTIRVEANGSNEIFVTDIRSDVTIRVSNFGTGIIVTTLGSIMTPAESNGLPAFKVWKPIK